jgi:hypothetical protein
MPTLRPVSTPIFSLDKALVRLSIGVMPTQSLPDLPNTAAENRSIFTNWVKLAACARLSPSCKAVSICTCGIADTTEKARLHVRFKASEQRTRTGAIAMKPLPYLAPLLLAAVIASVAFGDAPSAQCPSCGCAKCRKICRLVCKVEEEIDYEYDVDCDDYCLPDTSKICGKKWVPDCKSLFGCRKILIWQPRCKCKIHTRKTLVKIPVTKKVPTYSCVVESVCCQCGKSKLDAQATAEARRQGMMPDSVDKPLAFDTGEAVDLAARTADEQAR